MVWAVAQLKPQTNAADIAITNLTRQKYDIFNPTYTVRTVRRGKIWHEQRPLFPQYLFFHVDIDAGQRWVPVKSTWGVNTVLVRRGRDGYDEPAPISPSFLENLRANSTCFDQANGHYVLKRGTKIRIIAGPFAGQTSIVQWADDHRIKLPLWMLGRNVETMVAIEHVEELTR